MAHRTWKDRWFVATLSVSDAPQTGHTIAPNSSVEQPAHSRSRITSIARNLASSADVISGRKGCRRLQHGAQRPPLANAVCGRIELEHSVHRIISTSNRISPPPNGEADQRRTIDSASPLDSIRRLIQRMVRHSTRHLSPCRTAFAPAETSPLRTRHGSQHQVFDRWRHTSQGTRQRGWPHGTDSYLHAQVRQTADSLDSCNP